MQVNGVTLGGDNSFTTSLNFPFATEIQKIPSDSRVSPQGTVALSDDGLVLVTGHYNQYTAGEISIHRRVNGSYPSTGIIKKPSPSKIKDYFGTSISVSGNGDRILVGSMGTDTTANWYEGAVFIFDYNGSTYNQTFIIKADPGPSKYTYFGRSVYLSQDGNTFLAKHSASGVDAANTVSIRKWDGSSWVVKYQLNTPIISAAAMSRDGLSFAIYKKDGNIEVFRYVSGSYTLNTTIIPKVNLNSVNNSEYNIINLSHDGSTLTIGYPNDTINSVINAGSISIYKYDGVEYLLSEEINASSPTTNGYYGRVHILSPDGQYIVDQRGLVKKLHNGNYIDAGVLPNNSDGIIFAPDSFAISNDFHTIAARSNAAASYYTYIFTR